MRTLLTLLFLLISIQASRAEPASILALSWSPAYCRSEGGEKNREQCAIEKKFGFIVHGLWPQSKNERGQQRWFCDRNAANLPDSLVAAQKDIMPAEGLIRHTWRKHGTCSGLTPEGYFAKIRKLYQSIAIPPLFSALEKAKSTSPQEITASITAANPHIPQEALAITCDGRLLREVRLCLSESGAPTPCASARTGACKRDTVLILPAR